MRVGICVLAITLSWVASNTQQRDAAALLEMRQALGGDAVLDPIQTLSFHGTRTQTFAGRGRSVSEEVFSFCQTTT